MKPSYGTAWPALTSNFPHHRPSQTTPDVCTATVAPPAHFTYSSFSYTQESTDRYATALTPSLSFSKPFAPALSDASTLLPESITYTTYSYRPNATISADGKFGQSAYNALWSGYSYSSTLPFTTTVSPTPVASSELVFPPPLYNAPTEEHCSKLPKDFIWGVAGSDWQIEGGLQFAGRGPGVLDVIGALPNAAAANDSVTADMNYFLYKQDIARLAAIGIPHYSFSIGWNRVVPFGVAGSPINTQAPDHYDDLIDTCLEYGLTPIVTLTHADSPTAVSADEATSIDDFLYYAKVVMARYADRVPIWVTFNEPNLGPAYFYKTWDALTNVLFAHARVYDWYKNDLKGTGQITMKFANNLALPLDPSSADDTALALRYQDFLMGIMCNPLFLGKQYPQDALDTPHLTLTALTAEQIRYLHGKIDFLALDAYISQFATTPPEGYEACVTNRSDPLWPECAALTNVQANGWLMGDASNAYSYIAPQYVRQQLSYIWNTFKPSGILVSEFGFPVFAESQKSPEAQRFDLERSLYYQDFLAETLKSIHEDGVNVIGALAWSFGDNNEFGSYANQYGMQTVNRTDGKFTRRYKRSMFDYVDFFHKHVEE